MSIIDLPELAGPAEELETVATAASLPLTAPIGSIRYTVDTGTIYTFDGVSWNAAAGGFVTSVSDTATVDLTVTLGALSAAVIQSGIDHGSISGLTDDDHLQYHTDGRALTWLGTRSTSDLPEGSNLYYTDERVDDRVDALIQDGTGLTWTYNDGANTLTGNVSLSAFDTDDLAEGATNLYFTDSRADARANAQITAQKGLANGLASLDAGGKVPAAQLPNSIMDYLGTWAASTNTPTLADGVGNAGDVYIASDAGTVNFGSGNITFAAGDWVIYSGAVWQKSVNSNAVASVNGFTGAVSLTTTDIPEGTNLYYTDERVDDRVAALISTEQGLTATYDDTANELTLSAQLAKIPTSATTLADSDVTLAATDGNIFLADAFTASRTVTLPGDVPKGTIMTFINVSDFEMVFKSSDTTTLGATGSDLWVPNPHIRRGVVKFQALVSSPTTPADWAVLDLQDYVQYSATTTGASTNGCTVTLERRGRLVYGVLLPVNDGAASGGNLTVDNSLIPNSFKPAQFSYSASVNRRNGNPRFVFISSDTNGVFVIGESDFGFTGNCFGENSNFTYTT